MISATNPSGNLWIVTEEDEGTVLWTEKVFPQAGGTEADAIALADVARNPPPPSEAQVADGLRSACIVAIDAHIDATAQRRKYNSAAHLATYVTSTVPAWAAEAQAFVAWRDAVWLAAYALMAQVEAQEVAPPTPADAVAAMPAITWPE